MPFLRNTWYVAAWSEEIPATGMFRRRLLGDDVLLVRGADGAARALRNRCAHRFAPLDRGERFGDVIECPYHGLRYDLTGVCVANPHGDGSIPGNARVRAYPVVERGPLVWIWMGDSALCRANLIPEFEGLDPERFAINRGYMHTPANYELMTDNIMDLGHIEFLHKGLLGSADVRRGETKVHQEGKEVHSNRLIRGEILPPALDALFETNGLPIDRWLDVRWHAPANMQLTVGVAPAGAPERVGRETPGVHLMTPETESTTHYFWSNGRDFRRDDAQLHQALEEGLRYAFEHQDKPMIEAVEAGMGKEDFWDLRPVVLACDAGAVRARLVLHKMIADEQGATP